MFELLSEAREYVRLNRSKGVVCPCCDIFVKKYPMPLTQNIVASLIWLVQEYTRTNEWVHIPTASPPWLIRSRSIGRLQHWNLAIMRPNGDEDKKHSGYWLPTEDGVRFMHDLKRVPRIAFVYNNKVEGYSDELTNIRKALADKFSYTKLMSGNFEEVELEGEKNGRKKR